MGNKTHRKVRFDPVSLDHAAHFIGRNPSEVAADAGLLAEAHLAAMRAYGSRECVVGMDVYNLEAEAYGCPVSYPDGDGVPVAGDPPYEELESLLALSLDLSKGGRIPLVLEAADQIAREMKDASVRLPVCGPFTVASHLIGLESMICELFSEPEEVGEVLDHLLCQELLYCGEIIRRGHSVTIYESSVTPPLLSPDLFRRSIKPVLAKLIEGLRMKFQSEAQLVIGGDNLSIAPDILQTGAGYLICPVESDQASFMAALAGDEKTWVRVNMDPGVFLSEEEGPVLREVERTITIARLRERASIGVLLPFRANPALVLRAAQAAGEL